MKKKKEGVIARPTITEQLRENNSLYQKYAPRNKQESRDLLLTRLIHEKDERLRRDLAEADRLKAVDNKNNLEEKVYKKVLAANPHKAKDWECQCAAVFSGCDWDEQNFLKENIEYTVEWLKIARKMVTTKRYRNIPDDIFIIFIRTVKETRSGQMKSNLTVARIPDL